MQFTIVIENFSFNGTRSNHCSNHSVIKTIQKIFLKYYNSKQYFLLITNHISMFGNSNFLFESSKFKFNRILRKLQLKQLYRRCHLLISVFRSSDHCLKFFFWCQLSYVLFLCARQFPAFVLFTRVTPVNLPFYGK